MGPKKRAGKAVKEEKGVADYIRSGTSTQDFVADSIFTDKSPLLMLFIFILNNTFCV